MQFSEIERKNSLEINELQSEKDIVELNLEKEMKELERGNRNLLRELG